MGTNRIETFGVWLGDAPMPEHSFTEVITEIPGPLQSVLEGSRIPDGRDGLVTISDVVRLWEGTQRPGWIYHDFDCLWKGSKKLGHQTLFAKYGSTLDLCCIYFGWDGLAADFLEYLFNRRTRDDILRLHYSVTFVELNRFAAARGKTLPKGSYKHGNILR